MTETPKTFDDVRALMQILGIHHTVSSKDIGKKFLTVTVYRGNTFIRWDVPAQPLPDGSNDIVINRRDYVLAKCGTISVWWWAITALLEPNEKAIEIVQHPDWDSGSPEAANQGPIHMAPAAPEGGGFPVVNHTVRRAFTGATAVRSVETGPDGPARTVGSQLPV